MAEMTYGRKAVGLACNQWDGTTGQRINELFAEIIDLCNDAREHEKMNGKGAERVRLYSIAITEAQTAQMWAEKARTWRD